MRDLTEADIENLLAEGEWRRSNNMGKEPMTEYEEWQAELNAPKRKGLDKDWLLVAIGVVAVALGMALLYL